MRQGVKRWHFVAAGVFGGVIAVELLLTLLAANSLPLFSRDAAWIGLGFWLLVGLPASVAFLLGARLLQALADRFAPVEPEESGRGLRMLAVAGVFIWVGMAILLGIWNRADGSDFIPRHLATLAVLIGMPWAFRPATERRSAGRVPALVGLAIVVALSGATVAGLNWQWPSAAEPSQIARNVPVHPGRVILVGIDGLCTETLERFEESGGSSDLTWLRERGLIAPLATIEPTRSPVVWTTIATGREPEDHGVRDFTSWSSPRLHQPIVTIPKRQGAFYWLSLARDLQWLTRRPASSLDVRTPSLWEITASHDCPVDVVGWWCTWPAQAVYGRLVSDKFYFWRDAARTSEAQDEPQHVTFPDQLEPALREMRRPPTSMSREEILAFLNITPEDADELSGRPYTPHDLLSELPLAYTMDETHYAIARRFIEDAPPRALQFFYFRGVDVVSHAAMKYSNLYPESEVGADDRERFGEVVTQYYRYTFRKLRHLVESAGDDAKVLVVSDHGFEQLGPSEFGHDHAPEGVMMLIPASPEKTLTTQASIFDVTPTLLWLAGHPIADDMPGRPLTELFDLPAGADPEPARIASHGMRDRERLLRSSEADETDAEMLEVLRGLGYIQ